MKKISILTAIIFSSGIALADNMPNPQLTPGVADPTLTTQVICAKGWSTSTVRDVPESLKKQVYQRYNVQPHQGYCSGPNSCEVDHLIPLTAGGANDIHNLWPQPYDGPMSAHDKDRLEVKLHSLVCSGQISLAQAQKEISTDWRVAYQKYMK